MDVAEGKVPPIYHVWTSENAKLRFATSFVCRKRSCKVQTHVFDDGTDRGQERTFNLQFGEDEVVGPSTCGPAALRQASVGPCCVHGDHISPAPPWVASYLLEGRTACIGNSCGMHAVLPITKKSSQLNPSKSKWDSMLLLPLSRG